MTEGNASFLLWNLVLVRRTTHTIYILFVTLLFIINTNLTSSENLCQLLFTCVTSKICNLIFQDVHWKTCTWNSCRIEQSTNNIKINFKWHFCKCSPVPDVSWYGRDLFVDETNYHRTICLSKVSKADYSDKGIPRLFKLTYNLTLLY